MNSLRLATAATAAMCLGAFLPSVASATDYCVYPNTSCEANNYQELQPALDQAASTGEADRILLGELTYVGDPAAGFQYLGTSPVEIVGTGRGRTTLTSPPNGFARVLLVVGEGSSVHDLTIRIPESPGTAFKGMHLIGPNEARRVELVEAQAQNGLRIGVALREGAVLEDSTVTMGGGDQAVGASLDNPSASNRSSTLRATVVRAGGGVQVWDGGTIERSRVVGGSRAVTAAGDKNAIRDSVLTITETYGAVLRVEAALGRDTNVTADGLTIFASPNLPDTGGIQVSTAPDPSRSAHLILTNSIVRGFTPIAALAGGAGTATISTSYSDYDPSGNIIPQGSITESHVSNVGDAGFDETTGSEHGLLPTSPLIDKGDPDAPQGLDVNGDPRIADGNGDGIARRDLGAFELQPAMAGPPPGGGTSGGPAADTQAPLISGFRSTRSVFAVARGATPRAARAARGTTLRYRVSEPTRVVMKIQRKAGIRYRTVGTLRRSGLEGPNRIRFTGRVGRRALRAGRYRAVLRAVDAAGNRSAPKVARFRIVR